MAISMPTGNAAGVPGINPTMTGPNMNIPAQPTSMAHGASGSNPANPLMTELPDIPPPPFMQPGSGSNGPAGPVAPTAQSFPLAGALPEIPPPHMSAPLLYTNIPKPAASPMQTMPPQMPPLPQNQPQPPQAPAQQPQSKGPTAPVDGGALNDATIRSLNERLNSEAESTRADAAMDFFKILEKNPALADDPQYKPYVDAFMEKIIKDPSAVVRQAGELALEMGRIKNPSPAVMAELQQIAQRQGAYNLEPGIVQGILASLQSGKFSGAESAAAPDAHGQGALPDAHQANGPQSNPQKQPADAAQLFQQGGGLSPQQKQEQPGGRLDVTSPQQQATPMQAGMPPSGQRLNLQEGPNA